MHQPADRDALLVYDAPESLLAAAAPLLRARAAAAGEQSGEPADTLAVAVASARDAALLRALVVGDETLTAVAFAALPLAVAACFDAVAFAPAPPPVAERPLEPADLRALRRFVAVEAERAGVAPERIADVTVAAHEVAANACMHGGGDAVMRVWAQSDRFCCEIADHGAGMDDPLAGLLAPPVTQPSGRGLWLARQLCDLVQLQTGTAGTTVRLQVALG